MPVWPYAKTCVHKKESSAARRAAFNILNEGTWSVERAHRRLVAVHDVVDERAHAVEDLALLREGAEDRVERVRLPLLALRGAADEGDLGLGGVGGDDR